MPERGLPTGTKMRHDSHYVEDLARANRTVGKILPVEKLEPNPQQPRTEIGDLEELTASIREQGVLEPLLVKPRKNGTYMIIAGERRWRASTLAGLKEVPCIELDIDENTIAEIALVENLQRKDLTIWEVADGLEDLTERFGYTHVDIAEKIGKSRTTVTESLAIAGLPKNVRDRCVEANVFAKSILVEITRQFDEKAMLALLDEILLNDLKRSDIREKSKRPRKRTTGTAKSGIGSSKKHTTVAEKPGKKNAYTYNSPYGEYSLTLEFSAKSQPTKKTVLIALKTVFDAVKAEGFEGEGTAS